MTDPQILQIRKLQKYSVRKYVCRNITPERVLGKENLVQHLQRTVRQYGKSKNYLFTFCLTNMCLLAETVVYFWFGMLC